MLYLIIWKPRIRNTFWSLRRRSAERRTVFDFYQLKEDLLKSEAKTGDPNFWKNREEAQKVSSEIAYLKEKVASWERLVSDVSGLAELSELSDDSNLRDEAAKIEKRFLDLERKERFSGKYDKGNA